jgi:hypothetical protein
MKEVLADYAVRALAWLESGVDIIQEELPLYIEELIKWNIAENIIYLILYLLGVITLGISAKLSMKTHKIQKAKVTDITNWDDFGYWVWFVLSILAAISLFIGGILTQVTELVQLYIAPRVWLVEYLTDLVTNNT